MFIATFFSASSQILLKQSANQTHKNIMAIASLKELAAIVLVKGYRPEEDTVFESEAEGIPILSTSRQTFEMTGEIYELLQKKGQ